MENKSYVAVAQTGPRMIHLPKIKERKQRKDNLET